MIYILYLPLCRSLLFLSPLLMICIAFYQVELYRTTESIPILFNKKNVGTRVKVFNDPLTWRKERNDRVPLVVNVALLLSQNQRPFLAASQIATNCRSYHGSRNVGLLLFLRTVWPRLAKFSDDDHKGKCDVGKREIKTRCVAFRHLP